METTVGEFTFRLSEMVLGLRSTFGTSHSSTSTRRNALVEISFHGHNGIAEVGLPPKKLPVYVADFNEVQQYFAAFVEHFQAQHKVVPPASYDPFEGLNAARPVPPELVPLFYALDTCPLNTAGFSRPPRNGIEGALMDLVAKMASVSVSMVLMDREQAQQRRPCFYTIAIAGAAEIESSARFGARYTPFFKVKCNADVANTVATLEQLSQLVPPATLPAGTFWTLDANAAWTPAVARAHLAALGPFSDRVKVIEQPFPTDFIYNLKAGADMSEWVAVRREYNARGFQLFADESVVVASDVELLAPYVDGVNIKLDKAGGLREARRAIAAARSKGLRVWIGMMVGSVVACANAGAVLPLADYGDLDGGLLVDEASQRFTGGFRWCENGYVEQNLALPGYGLLPKH
eukprot:GAFH01002130.1.p1 GENE.GAFH01002130.1~~GAFH01002130.1.p1  ORF type:complete len:405 (-),score=87.75 GAFH01002130.1:28-1242(-)